MSVLAINQFEAENAFLKSKVGSTSSSHWSAEGPIRSEQQKTVCSGYRFALGKILEFNRFSLPFAEVFYCEMLWRP